MSRQSKETIAYRAALKRYNQLAKKADRRMRELERFSRYDEFKGILNYAYKNAAETIKAWTPPGTIYESRAPRWQRNVPLDTRSLKAKTKDIERFLSMKSSTVTGVKDIYKKRAATINERFGTNFNWQQLAHFFEDGGLADKAFDHYGSATVLLAVGKIQKNKTTALKAIESFDNKHKITDSDAATQETINLLLKDYSPEVQDLLSEKR